MDFVCPHKCSYRTNSGYCGSTGGWESCQYRPLHQPNTVVGYVPPLKKTNYDRIIYKTPEELAEWINNEYGSADWCPVDAPVDPVTRMCLVHDDCAECIVEWLKQEVKDNE